MIPRIRVEKLLHRRRVDWALRCGSIKDCVDPLLGIKHHNDFWKLPLRGLAYDFRKSSFERAADICEK